MSVIEGKKDLIIYRAGFVRSTLFEEVVVVLFKNIPSWILLMALASGCQVTPTANTEDVKNTNLTVGLVQQNINLGTSASDVLRVLGSPNIVKKSKNQGEVWVYDKFSTEQMCQSVSGALVLLTPLSGAVKARMNFVANTYKKEKLKKSVPIEDHDFYNAIFAKVDKSIFLEENL